MVQLALNPAYRAVEVDEFLDMDFGGARAELDDGLIYMMAGGSQRHAAISANIIAALVVRLRGSGCRPYGSDLAVRTGDRTIRFPDVSVYCRSLTDEERLQKLIGDPKIVFEVLSPSTSALDQRVKLEEYRALAGLDAIIFVDPERALVRIVERTAPDTWMDSWLPQGSNVTLKPLGVDLPHSEIFEA